MADLQELVRLGPFEGIDQTSSRYNLNPAFAIDGINFDVARNYRAFSLCQGRKHLPQGGSLDPNATSLGIFYEGATQYVISYSLNASGNPTFTTVNPYGSNPPEALQAPAEWPGATIPPYGYFTGTSAQYAEFDGILYITTNGQGISPYAAYPGTPPSIIAPSGPPAYGSDPMGDMPLKLASGLALTAWQINPPLYPPGLGFKIPVRVI